MTGAITPAAMRALNESWRRVSRQHLALGAACGCGFGFSLQASDLEEDICSFLEEAARREKRDDVLAFLSRLPRSPGAGWTLGTLFSVLAESGADDIAAFIAPRLATSIGSLEQTHGGTAFRCD